MKFSRLLLTVLAALGLLLPAFAQSAANAENPELTPIINRITAKLKSGPQSEASLAPELAELEALLAKHEGEKTEAVARVMLTQAILYAQVFRNTEKGVALMRQVKTDFPDTDAARNVDRLIENTEAQAKAQAAHEALKLSAAPAPAVPPTGDAGAELADLFTRIKAKLQTGQPSEAYLAPELAEFDNLLAKHQGEKTEAVSQILFSKAVIYMQLLKDNAHGIPLMRRMKTEFPSSEGARNADHIIAAVEAEAKAAAEQALLIGKPAPSLNFRWLSRTGPKSLADLKGKVVVLDFWTTGSRANIAAFPSVSELAAHYQGYEVEIIGVTSLQGHIDNFASKPIDCKDNPAKELELLPIFIQAKGMTWTVAVAEEDIFKAGYAIASLPFMAVIAPDGTVRHLALNPTMPLANMAQRIDAILSEFNLKLPPKGV